MKKLLFLFLLLPFLHSCKDNPTTPDNNTKFDFKIENLCPAIIDSSALVIHGSYRLEYAEQYEEARWVIYKLNSSLMNDAVERKDDFREDPLVLTVSAQLPDYSGSGYDRGHLKPAEDSKLSVLDMSESFYLSNMTPQLHGFNAGIWLKAENYVRNIAKTKNEIWVVTGPILTPDLPTIGSNKVAIPEYFYKIIVAFDNPITSIAYIIKHESTTKELSSFQVTIDSVEKVSGLDFFKGLPDSLENVLEKQIWIR